MGFQDPGCNMMEGLINFHHDVMTYLIFIAIFVLWFLIRIIHFFYRPGIRKEDLNHNTVLEIVWTVVPALILISIGIPSFSLLYAMDELRSPTLALKIVGHQWYWFYEYIEDSTKGESEGFVSRMEDIQGLTVNKNNISSVPQESFNKIRLGDVDNVVYLPMYINIRMLVTSADALHSWAVPSLGIKMDACPGRLNQLWTNIKRHGIYYGQCSEICGVNHAFMPIVIKAARYTKFFNWSYRANNCLGNYNNFG